MQRPVCYNVPSVGQPGLRDEREAGMCGQIHWPRRCFKDKGEEALPHGPSRPPGTRAVRGYTAQRPLSLCFTRWVHVVSHPSWAPCAQCGNRAATSQAATSQLNLSKRRTKLTRGTFPRGPRPFADSIPLQVARSHRSEWKTSALGVTRNTSTAEYRMPGCILSRRSPATIFGACGTYELFGMIPGESRLHG